MSVNSIEEAYCVELDDVVDIQEASLHYFAQPETKRRRLNFQCADDRCRATLAPLIVAVNYDKETFKQTPHFKTHSDHPHLEDCSMHRYAETLNKMMENKAQARQYSERNIFVEGLEEPEKVVDCYISHEEFASMRMHGVKTLVKKREEPSDPANAKACICKRVARNYYKTRLLEDVVDGFETLAPGHRQKVFLTMNGIRLKYSTIFKHIRYIDETKIESHIYYGLATVYRYKEGFRVFYKESTQAYSALKQKIEVTAFISHDKLQNPAFENLKSGLEKANADRKIPCCFYTLAKKCLEYTKFGSNNEPKDWIILSSEPHESVIRFNERPCI